jgi:hypothetical protein
MFTATLISDSEEPVSKKKKKKVGSANLNSSRASGRAKPSIKYSYDSGNGEFIQIW